MTVWYVGWNESHPYTITNTKCRIDTVISLDDAHMVARKNREQKEMNTKKNCAPSWLYLQESLLFYCFVCLFVFIFITFFNLYRLWFFSIIRGKRVGLISSFFVW
jgi:hypothetical protein